MWTEITHELGNPPGGVEPSYKQRFPRGQRLRCTVVKCSAISCKPQYKYYNCSSKRYQDIQIHKLVMNPHFEHA